MQTHCANGVKRALGLDVVAKFSSLKVPRVWLRPVESALADALLWRGDGNLNTVFNTHGYYVLCQSLDNIQSKVPSILKMSREWFF